MKNLYILVIILALLLLPLLYACESGSSSTVPTESSPSPTIPEIPENNDEAFMPIPKGSLPEPTGPEAPDDIVITPGGNAYRANVHQEGVPDKWPSIQSVYKELDSLNIHYRSIIETKAGETRNNIISVYGGEALIDSKLTLYSFAVPDGMKLTDIGGGGRPGMLLTVLAIEISPDIIPDQYAFFIGIEIDGEDYGMVPCIIEVIE